MYLFGPVTLRKVGTEFADPVSLPSGVNVSATSAPPRRATAAQASISTPATYPPPEPHTASKDAHRSFAAREVSPPRSQSQPAPSSRRKSVQFADKPEVSTDYDTTAAESEASSPERHRHKNKYYNSRGYESDDDTDTTPAEERRGHRERSSRSFDLDPSGAGQDKRKSHRRHQPTSSRGGPRDPPIERVTSPSDSDATVELPPRFDEQGRRKPDPGEDPLADRLEEILAGRGVAGKVFGNFLDGLLGPEGRKKRAR